MRLPSVTSFARFETPICRLGSCGKDERFPARVLLPGFLYRRVSPGKVSPKKQELVDTLCTAVPTLAQGRELVVAFKDLMRRRACEELEDWLERAKESGIVGFSSFVRGIRADYSAVKEAFSLEWSNGPVEGHVNRLKFIKRQGYGRASFDLLKRRVLPLTA